MLTQEEIRVQIGVDNSQLQGGLNQAGGYVEHFGNKMVTKFNRVIAMQVFHMAKNLVTDLLPSANQFWDSFYGVGKEQGSRLDKFRASLRDMRQAIIDSMAKLGKDVAALRYENATPEGRREILRNEITLEDLAMQKSRARAEWSRQMLMDSKAEVETKRKLLTAVEAEAAAEKRRKPLGFVGWDDELGTLNWSANSPAMIAKVKKAEEDLRADAGKRAAIALEAGKFDKEAVDHLDKRILAQQKLDGVETEITKNRAAAAKAAEQHDAGELKRAGDLLTAKTKLAAAERAPLLHTLEELAQDRSNRTPWGRQAGDILQLEQWASWNSRMNRGGLAEEQMKKALELRKVLQGQDKNLIDPFKNMEEAGVSSARFLEEIVMKGVSVKVPED